MAEPFQIGITRDFLTDAGEMPTPDFGQARVEQTSGQAAWRLMERSSATLSPEEVAGYDALLVGGPLVTAASVADAPRLKLIARLGVGYDNVDLAACTAADVAVTITAGAVDHPMAEGIVTLMLSLTHHLLPKDRLVREGRWQDKPRYLGTELRDRTLGIIGFGRIARRTLRVLSGFGTGPTLACDPYVDETAMHTAGVRKVDLPTLLREADVVLVTCALTEETQGLIGADELAQMRPSAYLINAARGPIVQQQPLCEALEARRIAGAALDVFEVEPGTADLPFNRLENVVLAPHAIGHTHELFRDMGHMAFQAALDVMADKPPHGLLNPEVWDRPGFQAKLEK